MKKLLLSLSALSMLFFVACGDEKKEEEGEGEKTETDAGKEEKEAINAAYTIDREASYIQWESWKAGNRDGHGHNGKVKIDGVVQVVMNKVEGGSATVDMGSIYDADIDGESLKNLMGHLRNGADMFAVDSLGAPKIMFNSYDGENINATLTIRGNSNEISIPATTVVTEEGVVISSDKFMVDMTKFGIPYFEQVPEEELEENQANMNPEAEFLVVVHAKPKK